jgi:epoxyqueuosine reductase QueG
MPEIALELTYEKILEAAAKLTEEEKERLLFSLNNDYAKALDEMGKEARESHKRGESLMLKDLK